MWTQAWVECQKMSNINSCLLNRHWYNSYNWHFLLDRTHSPKHLCYLLLALFSFFPRILIQESLSKLKLPQKNAIQVIASWNYIWMISIFFYGCMYSLKVKFFLLWERKRAQQLLTISEPEIAREAINDKFSLLPILVQDR